MESGCSFTIPASSISQLDLEDFETLGDVRATRIQDATQEREAEHQSGATIEDYS